jgi:hypothetical protein
MDSTKVFSSYGFEQITKINQGFQKLMENITEAYTGVFLKL